MSPILSWGLDVVRSFQSLASPALTATMRGISLVGTEYFVLAILPLIYWCVDKRRGIRIGALVLMSAALNTRLKLAFAQPRPYDIDPSVGMAKETTFGLPSGHAQGSAVFAGATAPLFRAPWGLAFALALPLLVGLSRIYLGVHFPTDVLAGWAIGAGIVGLDYWVGDRIERALAGLHDKLALGAVAAVAIVMNFLTNNDAAISGAFFGFAGAAIYAQKAAPFSVKGSFPKRLVRYLFGLLTLVIVYAAPKLLLGNLGSITLVRFIRYALVGAWTVAGAPWLFLKLRLADEESYSASEKDLSVSSK
jgi:Membrane-associated phospholipid phosphatase